MGLAPTAQCVGCRVRTDIWRPLRTVRGTSGTRKMDTHTVIFYDVAVAGIQQRVCVFSDSRWGGPVTNVNTRFAQSYTYTQQ